MATDRRSCCSGFPTPHRTARVSRRAGLDQRVEVSLTCRSARRRSPSCSRAAEAMLAFRAGAGVLAQMPRLRWLQALTGGVEGWLALPDLPRR